MALLHFQILLFTLTMQGNLKIIIIYQLHFSHHDTVTDVIILCDKCKKTAVYTQVNGE